VEIGATGGVARHDLAVDGVVASKGVGYGDGQRSEALNSPVSENGVFRHPCANLGTIPPLSAAICSP
jgi:hypothetical protein